MFYKETFAELSGKETQQKIIIIFFFRSLQGYIQMRMIRCSLLGRAIFFIRRNQKEQAKTKKEPPWRVPAARPSLHIRQLRRQPFAVRSKREGGCDVLTSPHSGFHTTIDYMRFLTSPTKSPNSLYQSLLAFPSLQVGPAIRAVEEPEVESLLCPAGGGIIVPGAVSDIRTTPRICVTCRLCRSAAHPK